MMLYMFTLRTANVIVLKYADKTSRNWQELAAGHGAHRLNNHAVACLTVFFHIQ
jgi:hypothetical protein